MTEQAAGKADAIVTAPGEVIADVEPQPTRPWLRWVVMAFVPALLLVVGGYLWLTSGRFATTDNAYVQQNVISVAPEVGGRITRVAVRENQRVREGDLLFRIDDQPYRIALQQAEASLADARLKVAQLSSGYVAKTADVGSKTADIALAQENLSRQAALLRQGFTTRARYDDAVHALAAAKAEGASAQADALTARNALGKSGQGGHPLILAAAAQREKALLDLKRTVIRAPQDGVISQTSRLQPGQLAIASLPALSLVTSDDSWIEANFKETQLAKMHVGQAAEIEFDAIPGRSFRAHVIGIGAGTGSEFSVLPAQNATGNWVKVVQRVPVRLTLDEKIDRPLAAGLSAKVTVDIRR